MTDVEYCNAVVRARRVRDDAILPLLHRVTTTPEDRKIHWDYVRPDGNNFWPDSDNRYSATVESDPRRELGAAVFSIKASVTVEEDGRQLGLSVICEHTNANPGALAHHRSKVLYQSPESSESRVPIEYIGLDAIRKWDAIRTWYANQFRECVAKCEEQV